MAVTDTARVIPLEIEAVGDGFALLSGEWFDWPRVAAHVKEASRVWAFAVGSREDIATLAEAGECAAGERIIGIAPGMHPDWPEAGSEPLLRLLGGGIPDDGVAGLLLSVPAPDCANCPGTCGGTCNKVAR